MANNPLIFSPVSLLTPMDIKSGYAPVNGLKLYYEMRGSGRPLVLLHGGVGASEMFDPLMPALAEKRKTVAVHLQGHGHTVDIPRPLRFESMADDIAAMIKYLNLVDADLMGYSLGGGVALQTAIRHPEVVRRLVLISAPFKQHGFFDEVLAGMAQLSPEAARFMSQSLSPNATLRPIGRSCSANSATCCGSPTIGRRKPPRSNLR